MAGYHLLRGQKSKFHFKNEGLKAKKCNSEQDTRATAVCLLETAVSLVTGTWPSQGFGLLRPGAAGYISKIFCF